MTVHPTSDPIPLVKDLETVYSKERLVKEGKRWHDVCQRFENEFGAPAQHIARAPGRVNLMGESHAFQLSARCFGDGYPYAFPCADARFESTIFESDFDDPNTVQLQHSGNTRWANYFKVAFKGLHSHLPKSVLSSRTRPVRISVLIDGTIPPESSLSSSAAMTCCSSIVILQAFGARELISRREMAEVAIESERLVGVASGGLDQAASIFGVAGSALHVSFVPELAVAPIKIPSSDPPHAFVIANTLVVSDKKVTGPVQYNLRVGELRMACRVLCRKLDLPQDQSTGLLKNLMDVYFRRNALHVESESQEVQDVLKKWGTEAAQMVKLRDVALKVLPREPQTRSELEILTGYQGSAFDDEFLSQFPIRAEKFELYKRVRHVFNESLNVLHFKAICQASAPDAYEEMGKIIHASQQTLFYDYENGCAELETVCQLAESHGALGTRPTGAGWGGSTVSLVPTDRVADVLHALRTGYYDKYVRDMSDEKFADAVLVSQPAAGACVYKV